MILHQHPGDETAMVCLERQAHGVEQLLVGSEQGVNQRLGSEAFVQAFPGKEIVHLAGRLEVRVMALARGLRRMHQVAAGQRAYQHPLGVGELRRNRGVDLCG